MFGFGKKNDTFQAFDNSCAFDNSFALGTSTTELIPSTIARGQNSPLQSSDGTSEKKGLAARVRARAMSRGRSRAITEETEESRKAEHEFEPPEKKPTDQRGEQAPNQAPKSSRRRWRSPLKNRDSKSVLNPEQNCATHLDEHVSGHSSKTTPVSNIIRNDDNQVAKKQKDDEISLSLADIAGEKIENTKDMKHGGRRNAPLKDRRSPKQTEKKDQSADSRPLDFIDDHAPNKKQRKGKEDRSVAESEGGTSVFSRLRNSSPLRSRRTLKNSHEEIKIANPYLDTKQSPPPRPAILRAPSQQCVSPSKNKSGHSPKTTESPPRGTTKRSPSSPRRRWNSPNKASSRHHALDSPPDSPVSVGGVSQISEITTRLPQTPFIEDVSIIPDKPGMQSKAFLRSQSTKEPASRSVLAAPSMQVFDTQPQAKSERHIHQKSKHATQPGGSLVKSRHKHRKSPRPKRTTALVDAASDRAENTKDQELKMKFEPIPLPENDHVVPSAMTDTVAQLEMHASGLSLCDLAADLQITLDPQASLVNHVDEFRKSQSNLSVDKTLGRNESHSERGTRSSVPLSKEETKEDIEKSQRIAALATPAKRTRRITSNSKLANGLKVGVAPLADCEQAVDSKQRSRIRNHVASRSSHGERMHKQETEKSTDRNDTGRARSNGESRSKSTCRSRRPSSAGRASRARQRSKSSARPTGEESPRRRSKSALPKKDSGPTRESDASARQPPAETDINEVATSAGKTRRRSVNLSRSSRKSNDKQQAQSEIEYHIGPVPQSPSTRHSCDESHPNSRFQPTTQKRRTSKSPGRRGSQLERRASSRRSMAQPTTPKSKRGMIDRLKKEVGSSSRDQCPKTPKTASERERRAKSVGRRTPTSTAKRENSVDVLVTPRRDSSRRTRVAPSQADKEAIAKSMSSRSMISQESVRLKVKMRKKHRKPEIPQLQIPSIIQPDEPHEDDGMHV